MSDPGLDLNLRTKQDPDPKKISSDPQQSIYVCVVSYSVVSTQGQINNFFSAFSPEVQRYSLFSPAVQQYSLFSPAALRYSLFSPAVQQSAPVFSPAEQRYSRLQSCKTVSETVVLDPSSLFIG